MGLVFFDIDGTLSVPNYIDKAGNEVVGFSEEGWAEYCKSTGEDGYKDCLIVQPVVRYAMEKKSQGDKLFVLSTAGTHEEVIAKHKFINTNFPGMFEEVLTVSHDKEKVLVIKEKSMEYGVDIADCELVEDTYSIVLNANDNGIKATHISRIIYNL